MLELKSPVEKVAYDCGTEDSHRAKEEGVIIPVWGLYRQSSRVILYLSVLEAFNHNILPDCFMCNFLFLPSFFF